jgi:hypothetical protein
MALAATVPLCRPAHPAKCAGKAQRLDPQLAGRVNPFRRRRQTLMPNKRHEETGSAIQLPEKRHCHCGAAQTRQAGPQ